MKQSVKQVIAASIIGNVLEWYDFVLYGIFAAIISQQFFPHEQTKVALMAGFATLAIGYFMRPVGGIVFGHLGDKVSRRTALIIAIISMGLATTLIGFLPSYYSIGIAAPILLIVLRMVQGFAVAGEYSGSMVLLTESAKPGTKAFFASLSVVGACGGILLGVGVSNLFTLIFPEPQLHAWGWRLGFIFGFFLALIGLYLRLNLLSVSEGRESITHIPIVKILQQYKQAVLTGVLMFCGCAVFTSIFSVFLVPYLTQYIHFTMKLALQVMFWSTVLAIIGTSSGAWIADKLQHYRNFLIVSQCGLLIAIIPLYCWIAHGGHSAVWGMLILTLISTMAQGPLVYMVVGLFPRAVRYSGTALVHSLAFSFLVGVSPLFLNWFALHFGAVGPAYYYVAATVISIVTCFFVSDQTIKAKI